MNVLPKALEELIEALGALPGVGPRTAERYAFYLFGALPDKSHKLASSLDNLHESIKLCPVTFALIDSGQEVSPLYDAPTRDKSQVLVVAEPFDIAAIEAAGGYNGTYHVLGGLISPIDNIGPEQLHISELVARVKKDKVDEIILGTNASVEGETTALYVQKQLAPTKVKLTRLARGLPIGLDLAYADQITLGRALEGRQAF